MNKKEKQEKAITLVALVIIIVILLILSGISISIVRNQGLLENAKEARNRSEQSEKEQSEILDSYEKELNKYETQELTELKTNIVLSTTENVKLHDTNGNNVVVPAGFKIISNEDTNNAITVEKGIVVEDSNGNQYVWIPCTIDNSKTKLQYKRTEWNVEDDKGSKAIRDELTLENSDITYLDSDIENGITVEVTKNIVEQVNEERESIRKYGGYYIGRYETGKEQNEIVIKKNEIPYTNIKWKDAYNFANKFIDDKLVKTYLCSSYSWDTAVNFIQNNGIKDYATTNIGFNENYKSQVVINKNGEVIKKANEELKLNTGLTTPKSNIFDIGGNVAEFTTELNPGISESVIVRGNNYLYNRQAGYRYDTEAASGASGIGFRITLFLR